MESDKPQKPGQETPIPTRSESKPQQSEETIPSGDQANLHFYSLLEQYNASRHQNEIREQKRDAIDRKRLRVEKAAVWVGVAGILGLLLNLCETRRAVDVAIENAYLDQRAWVSVVVAVRGPFIFTPGGAQVPLQFMLKNTGNSPAVETLVHLQMFPWDIHKSLVVEQKKICANVWERKTSPDAVGIVVSPGDSAPQDATVAMSQEDIRHALEKFPSLQPVIVGCIDYRFPFAKGYHQTGFIYYLSRVDSINGALIFEPSVKSVPVENLYLSRDDRGSYTN